MENKERSRFSLLLDEELMFHLSNGETSAFDELYKRYSHRLLVYFTRMLNFDEELAKDALQDLFLKIAEVPEKFNKDLSFRVWIFSVASNTCKNFYRHKAIVNQSREEITHLNKGISEDGFLTAARKIDAGVFHKILNETLDKLPLEKKEAFILKYQEEKSLAEIAEIQQCPEGSVKSRIHYTIKILEEQLHLFNPLNQSQ